MYTIIRKNFEDYKLWGALSTEGDEQRDFFSGEKLNDRILISIIKTSESGYIGYYFGINSSTKLIERLNDSRKIEGCGETDCGGVFCVDDLSTTTNSLRTNLEELIDELGKIDYRQPFENSFVLGKEELDIYDIETIPSETDEGEALVFGGIAIVTDLIDSDFDFYDYLTEPDKKDVAINSCGYCTEVSLSTSTKEIAYYNIEDTNTVCKDCASIIRKRCAEFGNNQELIKKIVSEKI